jgi:hypothetical protein
MRKRIVGLHGAQQAGKLDQGWLDLEQTATVEVLELAIQPDLGGREAVATLASWRLC